MHFASFLKPMFPRPALGTAGSVQLEPAVPPVSTLNQEMPVEVMTDFDTVLLFGRLAETGPACLKIELIQGEMHFPVLYEGSLVLIRGYNAQIDPVLLQATVARSSGFECVVEHLERIYYETGRKLIRYPVCPPQDAHVSGQASPERLQPCRLLNISAGGACIVSEQLYMVGQSLRIRITLAEHCADCLCQVVRATPRRAGLFEYGLRFVHLGREQRGYLALEIRDLQEETRNKLHPNVRP